MKKSTFLIFLITVLGFSQTSVPVLQNASAPYTAESTDGRWGTLAAPWITNDAALSHGGFGGWDSFQGLDAFNLESGWGSADIVNGKIYQVIALDPGAYTLSVDVDITNYDTNPNNAYFVVSKGDTGIPDQTMVETATDVLGFQKIEHEDPHFVDFVIEETTEVSIGIVTTQIGNYYCRILSWNLNRTGTLTDVNFQEAINTCLSTNPVDGLCSDSKYGAMPDWDVSQVTNMSNAFKGKSDFNVDLSAWDVSNVTEMVSMLDGTALSTEKYDALLTSWSVLALKPNVSFTSTNLQYCNAEAARQSIIDTYGWTIIDAGRPQNCVTPGELTPITNANFQTAINNCLSTNPVDGLCSNSEYGVMTDWDVSQITDMSNAFSNKEAFNADLSAWDVSNVADMTNMFENTALSIDNYDALLKRWSALNLQPDVVFGAGNVNYCFSKIDREKIVNIFDWKITDGGYVSCRRAITDANFKEAINTCLSTNPVDGLCSNSEYGAMPDWDVSQVTDMSNAFEGRSSFNADISAWDVSNVINMANMFYGATSFNQHIGGLANDRTLAKTIEEDSSFSLFEEVMKVTGWYDVLNEPLVRNEIIVDGQTEVRYSGHLTVLAQTDEVFEKEGLNSIEDIKARYSHLNDPTSPQDSLNLFMAYRIVPGLNYMTDLVLDQSVLTKAPLETVGVTLSNDSILINEYTFDKILDKGVEINKSNSDVTTSNGVIHTVKDNFFIKKRLPAPVYFDLADQPEFRQLSGVFRKPGNSVTLSKEELFDVTWEGSPGITYTAPSVGVQSASGWHGDLLDVLRLRPGYINNIEFTTPVIIKGQYKIWVSYRVNGRGPESVKMYYDDKPLAGTLNMQEYGNSVEEERVLESQGYKSHISPSKSQFNCRLLGIVTVETTGRHKIRFENLAVSGGNSWFDVVEFRPIEMDQLYPKFESGGSGLIYE